MVKRQQDIRRYGKRVKREYVKVVRRRPVPRMIRSRIPQMNYSRTFWLQNWSPSTVATNDFWRYYTFTLSQVPNYGELTSLFDQYKISALKYTFRPRYDGFMGNDTVDTVLPGVTNQGKTHVHIVNDPKSTISPGGVYNSTTLNSFFEQGRVKTRGGNRAFSVYFKPCVANDADGVNIAQYVRAPWLNTSTNAIVHRGFHIFLQDINLTGVFGQSYDVFVTPYMKFKNMR